MFRVSMMYPNDPGSTFDMDYFVSKHIPRIREIFMDLGLADVEVQEGIGGAMPGAPAPFICISSFLFETMEGFGQGFAAEGAWITGDVANYTNVRPQIQFGRVVVEN